MRKLIYTVVLSCTSMLWLPHAAGAGSLDPVREDVIQKPDNVIVDVAPVNPVTPVDPGIIDKDLVDVDTNIKDFDKDGSSGSIGSITDIIGSSSIGKVDTDKAYTGSEDLNCKSISCADLGYSQRQSISCEEYIYCPFDLSYRICTKYKGEYSFDSCPSNAICESKYQITDCQDGYDMFIKSDGTVSCMITLDPTPCKTIAQVCASSTSASPQYKSSLLSGCYEECTLEDIVEDLKDPFGTKKCTACPSSSSCATGEELGTLSDGSKKCFKTVCGKSPDILLLGVGTYATLENGNRVIVTCASGYKRISDSNGCFRCSIPISGGGSSGGTLVTTCPTGTYESGPACQNCSNGYVLSGKYGTLSCYRCCTAEENSVAGACMHCLK